MHRASRMMFKGMGQKPADSERLAVMIADVNTLDRSGRRQTAFCHQCDSRTNRKMMRL
jgi:hypothetical protein